MPTQKDIYNAIAQQEAQKEFRYSTAAWAWEIEHPFFAELPLDTQKAIVEIGSNDGQMANRLRTTYPETPYVGLDISSAAVGKGNQRLKQEGIQKALLMEGNIMDAEMLPIDPENVQLFFANYVGPSVGLENLVARLAELEKPFLILDRLYTPDQVKKMQLTETARTFFDFIRFFREQNRQIPWTVFLQEMTRPMIYQDVHYQQGWDIYSKNAPGNAYKFGQHLHDTYGDLVQIRQTFGKETALITGNWPKQTR